MPCLPILWRELPNLSHVTGPYLLGVVSLLFFQSLLRIYGSNQWAGPSKLCWLVISACICSIYWLHVHACIEFVDIIIHAPQHSCQHCSLPVCLCRCVYYISSNSKGTSHSSKGKLTYLESWMYLGITGNRKHLVLKYFHWPKLLRYVNT